MKSLPKVLIAMALVPAPALGEDNLTTKLINPWYYCVGSATGRQADRFRNPEIAVERAFIACQTEEMAVRSYGEMSYVPLATINGIIASHKIRLKQRMIESLAVH